MHGEHSVLHNQLANRSDLSELLVKLDVMALSDCPRVSPLYVSRPQYIELLIGFRSLNTMYVQVLLKEFDAFVETVRDFL